MPPKITVLTATYNRETVLPDAIRSVLRQDFPDFEHFILDDGSTDNTKKAVEPFLKDKRVRYFKRPHRGQFTALNWGLKKARTRLVCFLDSDDEFKKNHLSTCLSEFEKDPLVWKHFQNFSAPYRRIRVGYIEDARSRPEEFQKRLRNFLKKTRQNKKFGMVQ